ncbi:hypothetical protein [Papillibacter cinnamivorans]|uniref:Short C-terminal domain-containing protein n=1 Tax=Papillibacter cinnamivorans DSM 12816 TaxID=1122930 RepID=A0A1W1ZN16_9FIRM|nr:hypothetical protein [Papillibacter cinnamivorans]SMC49757.1 hypothetical protein SAMN02745168_1259 [Papillibacter cinnamivorans DSM 12816]
MEIDRPGLERVKREWMLSALKKLLEEQIVTEEAYRRTRSALLKERPPHAGAAGKSDTGRG